MSTDYTLAYGTHATQGRWLVRRWRHFWTCSGSRLSRCWTECCRTTPWASRRPLKRGSSAAELRASEFCDRSNPRVQNDRARADFENSTA